MAKTKSTFMNMFLTLFIISVVVAGALGYVNSITEKPIAKAKKVKQENAVKEVLPPFETLETKRVKPLDGNDSLTFHFAYNNNKELVGTAIETYTEKGFSGRIDIMVGFLSDGNIYNTTVINHKETPGLGSKMLKEKFKNQFLGKNPEVYKLNVRKSGGDVDAITAATISSKAFCDAVQHAYNALQQERGENEN